jgi:purine catabolism regulator
MATGAKDPPPAAQDLPTAGVPLGAVTVAEMLGVPSLAGSRLAAGGAGLHRRVERVNVMEVPDILPWVKPHEVLFTTGYALRDTPEDLTALLGELAERGLAGLAVKPGRYLDGLPAGLVEEADRLEFPLIELSADVGFDDVLTQVLRLIVDRQAATLEHSDRAHRALIQIVVDGGGLHDLVAELHRLTGLGVLATTPDGRVLAASGEWPAESAGRCFDHSGRFRVEHVGSDDQASCRVPHVSVRIRAGRVDHGRLVAFGSTDPDARVLLERAAMVAALAVTRELAVASVEEKYRGDFLRDVLVGRAGQPDAVLAHCAALGWDLERPMAVLVAELDVPLDAAPPLDIATRPLQDRFAAAWQLVVRDIDPTAAVAGFHQEVVCVVGAPDPQTLAGTVRTLVGRVAGDRGGGRQPFSTGVSRPVTGLAQLPVALAQARRSVVVGRQMHGVGGVAHFDELGVYRLISQVSDPAELRRYVAETLGPLAGDGEEITDLRRTLEVLLETNLNVAETARRLHFHYNTLRYRIGKLERMLGPFVEDPALRLNVSVALAVHRLRGL